MTLAAHFDTTPNTADEAHKHCRPWQQDDILSSMHRERLNPEAMIGSGCSTVLRYTEHVVPDTHIPYGSPRTQSVTSETIQRIIDPVPINLSPGAKDV